jgi:hypothetical protein
MDRTDELLQLGEDAIPKPDFDHWTLATVTNSSGKNSSD